MKPATITSLKQELKEYPQHELVDICLRLAKFKKENKELLTYLLYDSKDEEAYVQLIKEEIDEGFAQLNHSSLYYVKKGTRKILRVIKKYIRYSKKKETEVEVLLYFCSKWKQLKSRHRESIQMINIYQRQMAMAKKAIGALHEDLQYDYSLEVEELEKL